MKSWKSTVAGLSALAAAAGSALLLATPAGAVTTPSTAITNDPNASAGYLTFYDAAGQVITGGNDLGHLFDYAAASTAGRTGTTKATVYFAFPDSTKPNSTTWFRSQRTASTTFPNTTAPAPVNALTTPVATATASDANLAALLPTTTQDHSAGYDGILQIRLYDSGPGISQVSSPFWASDIFYDAAAGTWQQVFPSVATTAISAITATPASPAPSGTTSVSLAATLTASDASHPAGAVELFDGATDLGPATFDAASGAISATAAVADSTAYAFRFVFTPSAAVVGSTSPVLNYSVAGPAVATTTVLSGPTTTTTGTAVTIHADVYRQGTTTRLPAGAGSVQFKIDGTNAGGPVSLTAGGADFLFNPSAAGSNTVTASFTPADPANYVASADTAGVTVVTTAPAYAPSPADLTVTVPQGTLVISTPYTVQNPFKLGTMTLNPQGTLYSASAPFGDPNAPAAADPGSLGTAAVSGPYPAATTANGVTITDTRAGSTGWTASAQVTDFTNPSLSTVIPGNNLTFTGVTPKYLSGNALQAGDVLTNDITAFSSVKKAFATTVKGPGTVNITGVLGLTAATSTLPGDYTATLTFTIV